MRESLYRIYQSPLFGEWSHAYCLRWIIWGPHFKTTKNTNKRQIKGWSWWSDSLAGLTWLGRKVFPKVVNRYPLPKQRVEEHLGQPNPAIGPPESTCIELQLFLSFFFFFSELLHRLLLQADVDWQASELFERRSEAARTLCPGTKFDVALPLTIHNEVTPRDVSGLAT